MDAQSLCYNKVAWNIPLIIFTQNAGIPLKGLKDIKNKRYKTDIKQDETASGGRLSQQTEQLGISGAGLGGCGAGEEIQCYL